jgi:hypothetical protein
VTVRVRGVDVDLGPPLVGTFVAVAGALTLAEPVVGPVVVGPLRVRPIALGAAVLAAGLSLGSVVFYRRGQRLVAIAHAIGGVGWIGVVAGTALGSGVVLFAGLAVLLGGSLFLVAETRRTP